MNAADGTKKQWGRQFLIFMMIIYTAIEAPLSFALHLEVTDWQVWLDGVFTCIFAYDIIVHFKESNDQNPSPLQFKKKDKKYQHTLWFPIDVLASIPFDLIAVAFGLTHQLTVLRLVRLLRLLRIGKMFSMMGTVNMLPRGLKILLAFLWFGILVNWIAVGWMMIYPQQGQDLATFVSKAMYWSVTTLTTIGYGDITPTTNLGRVYTMVVMILGVGVYSIIIGSVSRLFLMDDKHKEAMKEKLHDLAIFMQHYTVPRNLQKQVFNYYGHILNQRLSENDTKIIQELPPALRKELEIFMNVKLIHGVPIFQNCPQICLKEVASSLEQNFYSPGEYIVRKGEMGAELFLIGHGEVEVVDDNGNVIVVLKEGQFFGEVALLESTKRNADVKARSYCDLYILTKESFLPILERYPILEKNIKSLAHKRKDDKERSPKSKKTRKAS